MQFVTRTLPWVGTAAALALLALQGASAQEQRRDTPYGDLAKLPNWRGVWYPDWQQLFAAEGGRRPAAPQTTPAATKTLEAFRASQTRGENTQTEAANCTPPGMPGIMRMPYPIEFLLSPERVTIITETESQVRRIYTDGRPLPEDPDPAFNGWSVGRWEGDTLVVDTIGLNPKNNLIPGLDATEQTRIQERIQLAKPGLIVIETTITDPTLFTAPLVQRQAYSLKPDWEIREYSCQENNRDSADEFGRPSMDIDFPEE